MTQVERRWQWSQQGKPGLPLNKLIRKDVEKNMTVATIARIRIYVEGKGEVGILHFRNGSLRKGAKQIQKALGHKLTANVVVLSVMCRFLKDDQDFGNFKYNGFIFSFRSVELEESLKVA